MKYTIEELQQMYNDGMLSDKGKHVLVKKLFRHGKETLKEERDNLLSENPPEPLKSTSQAIGSNINKQTKLCPIHKHRQLSENGYCLDCGAFKPSHILSKKSEGE